MVSWLESETILNYTYISMNSFNIEQNLENQFPIKLHIEYIGFPEF